MRAIYAHAIAYVVLMCADFAWIKFFMRHKYADQIRTIQNKPISLRVLYVVCAYACLLAGLSIFVMRHIRDDHIWLDAGLNGFLFGCITYGVYDFTNASLFDAWDEKLMILDILWGGLLFFVSAGIGSSLASFF